MTKLPLYEIQTVHERSLLLSQESKCHEAPPPSSKNETPPIEVARSEQSMLSRGWSKYNDNLEKWPLLVKGITAFFLLAIADGCAQGIEHISETAFPTSKSWDWLRTIRFGMFGLLGAPWSHYYFSLLDRIVPPTPDPWTWTTFAKLFIDQFIQAPILLALIIVFLNLMEGQGYTTIKQDLHDHYWNTLVTNWYLWLPASFVNLAFVKPTLRVLYLNVVFFFWTIILSVILHS